MPVQLTQTNVVRELLRKRRADEVRELEPSSRPQPAASERGVQS